MSGSKRIYADIYDFVGFGRGRNFDDESNPIVFRRDRFTLMGFEQIWLSPTPYEPGSRFEIQSGCPCVCVCATLKPNDGEWFRFFNTHLDHESESARVAGIREIFRFMKEKNDQFQLPYFLTGDFNAVPDSETLTLVRDHQMCDTTDCIPVTYHAFGREDPIKIDYIIVPQGAKWHGTAPWTDTDGVHFLSDHYPVETTLVSFAKESDKKL